MRLVLDHYQLEIDVEKTRQYYAKKAMYDGERCSCQGCRNFVRAVGSMPKAVSDFCEQFGIDVEEPVNISTFPCTRDGRFSYNLTYECCGKIVSEEARFIRNPGGTRLMTEKYHINEEFYVWFEVSEFVIDPKCPHPILTIEMIGFLPFVLDEEICSDYLY